MKMSYEPGDVVRLNSGSPDLTVEYIGNGPRGEDDVRVVWYDGGDIKTDNFPMVCLNPVNTLSPFVEILKTVEESKNLRNTSIVDLWKIGKES